MFIATVVVSVLLAAVLVFSGRGKLVRDPAQMATLTKVGFPQDKVWPLAAAEFAGALGLLVGLFWWPLSAAAATGVVLYFIGATTAHLRVGDKGIVPPLVLLLVAAAALVLRVLSA